MLKARFLHLTFLVAAGIELPISCLPGQRVTTQPRLTVVFHIIQISVKQFALYFVLYNNKIIQ